MVLVASTETAQFLDIAEASPEEIIDWLRTWRNPLAQAHEALLFAFVPPDSEVKRQQLVDFAQAAINYGQALSLLENNRPQDASTIIATVVGEEVDIDRAVSSEAWLVNVGQLLNLALHPHTPEDVSSRAIPKQYFLAVAANNQLYGKSGVARRARQVAQAIKRECVWQD